MKIQECLLNRNNQTVMKESTLGLLIAASGKEHLWESRKEEIINTVVIHFISAVEINTQAPYDLNTILGIFCTYGVSSHFLISRRGKVFRLVPEQHKAWHCGGSIMPSPDDRRGVNDFSIGIELMATADSGFTRLQYKSLLSLCLELESHYRREFIYVGHDQIAGERAVELGLRRDVKPDPGVRFDWSYFNARMEQLRQQKQENAESPIA